VREWQKAHPGYGKSWRENNLEKTKAYAKTNGHRRRAREKGAAGSWTVAEWIALKATLGNCYVCCHKTEQELTALGRKLVPDHIQALVTGGTNEIENLQPLCHGTGGCNNRKHAQHIRLPLPCWTNPLRHLGSVQGTHIDTDGMTLSRSIALPPGDAASLSRSLGVARVSPQSLSSPLAVPAGPRGGSGRAVSGENRVLEVLGLFLPAS
jgi:hypothetical protein